MNYAVEQRMRFIDFLLSFFGVLTRDMLTVYFGIGPAQATRDIARYKKMNNGSIHYSISARRYVRSDGFKHLYD